MRHFSAGKAFDETINSHTRVGSSIIQSTSVKDNSDYTPATERKETTRLAHKPACTPRGNSILYKILFPVTGDYEDDYERSSKIHEMENFSLLVDLRTLGPPKRFSF